MFFGSNEDESLADIQRYVMYWHTNERAIGDCVLAKICWSVCETETWISDSQYNLLHFELLIASLAEILTELL